jgi:hypothetical protein
MQRENEFRNFLINRRKGHKHSPSGAERYVKICYRIERYMSGRDMDELVISQAEVNATEKVLETKGSFTDTRAVLHAYYEFASTTKTGWTLVSSSAPFTIVGTGTNKTTQGLAGLVVYDNSVPSYDRIPGLCECVEKEYEKIREFAKRLLANIWQDFPAIPVYLSKERPEKTYYYDREFLLCKMREYCAKCERKGCEPPYCGIGGVLEKYAPFTHRINGRYFDGIEPHIVLYFKNFDKPHSLSNHHFAAEIAQTLAHEYWHFLHAYYVSTFTRNTVDPFEDERVSEAMADFFGVLYSRERGDSEIVEERYASWRRNDKNIWPYAYALHFLHSPYKSKFSEYSDTEIDAAREKLRYIFRATPDARVALSKLTK